jgi:hypothetical protein
MRSYIFTEREKQVIISFVEGRIDARDRALSVILARLKGFTNLASDVNLYLRLRELVSTKSA